RAGSREVCGLRGRLVPRHLEIQTAEWLRQRSERRAEPQAGVRPYGSIENRANFRFRAPSVPPGPDTQRPVGLGGDVAHDNCRHRGLLKCITMISQLAHVISTLI